MGPLRFTQAAGIGDINAKYQDYEKYLKQFEGKWKQSADGTED